MRNKNTTEDKDKKMTENATENVRRLIREKKLLIYVSLHVKKLILRHAIFFGNLMKKEGILIQVGWMRYIKAKYRD